MFSKARVLVLVLILVLSMSAFGMTHAQDDDTLKIGVLTDHSGALSIYGFEQTQGFELGLQYATDGSMEVAGRPVEIVVRDNGGDIDTALEQARELIESEGVEVLVGTVSSTVTLNLQASAAEYETVLLAGPSAFQGITGQFFNEYTFRVCRNSYQDAFAVANYAINTYGPNFIQLHPDSAFGQGGSAAALVAFNDLGAEPVRDTIFVAGDTTDFTPALTEVNDSGADFLYVSWAGASGVNLFNQLGELGVSDNMGVMTGFNSNDIQALLETNQNGDVGLIVYHYTLPDNEINDWMIEQYAEQFDDVPDLFSECGFASAQALVAALEISEGSTFAEDLIPALEGLEFEGPKGTYFIRPEDHQALVPMYVVEMTDATAHETAEYYTLLEEVSAEDSAPPCEAPEDRSSDSLTCAPPATE